MAIRAFIIDDEPLAIDAVRQMCQQAGTVDVIGHASDGASGLRALASHRPDLVFLDIGMPGMDGLELAALIKTWNPAPLVILVTAFDHYATQAFDLAVVDYLLKPLESHRFARALERAGRILAAPVTSSPAPRMQDFWVPHAGSIMRVPADSVQRIDAERDYVRLTVDTRSYLMRAVLSSLVSRLDPALFVQVHRSTIVRTDCVAHFRHLGAGAWEIIDRNGRPARVGRSYLAEAKARLGLALRG
jgi:two-component system response regulator AlgR